MLKFLHKAKKALNLEHNRPSKSLFKHHKRKMLGQANTLPLILSVTETLYFGAKILIKALFYRAVPN